MIVWIFPVLRNRKGNYIFFFLILAVTDPISISISQILGENPNYLGFLSSCLLFVFINKRYLKFNIITKKILVIVVIILSGYIFNLWIQVLMLLVDVLIIGSIILELLKNLLTRRKINIFIVVLSFYYFLALLNPFLILFNKKAGTYYFYITLIIMLFFGVFFSIFSDNSKILIINLKSKLGK